MFISKFGESIGESNERIVNKRTYESLKWSEADSAYDANSSKIVRLGDPAKKDDCANKKYVDERFADVNERLHDELEKYTLDEDFNFQVNVTDTGFNDVRAKINDAVEAHRVLEQKIIDNDAKRADEIKKINATSDELSKQFAATTNKLKEYIDSKVSSLSREYNADDKRLSHDREGGGGGAGVISFRPIPMGERPPPLPITSSRKSNSLRYGEVGEKRITGKIDDDNFQNGEKKKN